MKDNLHPYYAALAEYSDQLVSQSSLLQVVSVYVRFCLSVDQAVFPVGGHEGSQPFIWLIGNYNPGHNSWDNSLFCWKMNFVFSSPSPPPSQC